MSTSPGILSLAALLASMSPTLNTTSTFVFTTVRENPFASTTNPIAADDIEMLFREAEGWTLILSAAHAETLGLEANFPCRKITLNVHSSLDAVGFLAAVTTRLAREVQVGVNPVSGFYHDHLFVPVGKEEQVMEVLKKIAEEAKSENSV